MDDTPGTLIPFTPAAGASRHDGWTSQRQKAFIEALAETGCVQEACRRTGMSDSAAYRLRRRDPWFADAWGAALEFGLHRLEDAAVARAMNGVARPVFYKGEQVGEWRHHDERLTMFLLSHRRSARFGKWIDRAPGPLEEEEDDRGLGVGLRLVRAMDDLDGDGDDDGGDVPGDGR